MGDPDHDWFDPTRLFDGGYPDGLTSALRALDLVRGAVRDEVRGFGASTILEVGPGDVPLAEGQPGVVYLDVVPGFLTALAGARVVADLFHAPFAPGTFDLVVASDVLTHVRPARRREAVARLAELGRDILVFNPEGGTHGVDGSLVPSRLVSAFLEEHGYRVNERRFVAATLEREYWMRIITGRR